MIPLEKIQNLLRDPKASQRTGSPIDAIGMSRAEILPTDSDMASIGEIVKLPGIIAQLQMVLIHIHPCHTVGISHG